MHLLPVLQTRALAVLKTIEVLLISDMSQICRGMTEERESE